jgi:tRNA A37 threonylcarbamoyladenosine dehydratase
MSDLLRVTKCKSGATGNFSGIIDPTRCNVANLEWDHEDPAGTTWHAKAPLVFRTYRAGVGAIRDFSAEVLHQPKRDILNANGGQII